MKVSIVLPTYNEIGNIVPLIKSILAAMPQGAEPEVIVVDDSSPDGTYASVAQTFSDDARVTAILRTANKGLANSLREGLERSTGDFVILMDTDFTHDPAELPRMIHLLNVSEVVVGSRFCPGGSMDDIPHYCFSLIYNWFARIILRTQIQDNLSGFLGLSRTCVNGLALDAIFWGYGDYCFRLLHYAQRSGARILEMPVKYKTRQSGRSKSVFWKLVLSYTKALLKLRLRMFSEQTPP